MNTTVLFWVTRAQRWVCEEQRGLASHGLGRVCSCCVVLQTAADCDLHILLRTLKCRWLCKLHEFTTAWKISTLPSTAAGTDQRLRLHAQLPCPAPCEPMCCCCDTHFSPEMLSISCIGTSSCCKVSTAQGHVSSCTWHDSNHNTHAAAVHLRSFDPSQQMSGP
jgi:hypothetical protein